MNLTLILFNPKTHHYHLSLSFPIVLSGKKRRIEGEKEGEEGREGGRKGGKKGVQKGFSHISHRKKFININLKFQNLISSLASDFILHIFSSACL